MDPVAELQTPPIHINYSNPQEHVPEAERNNRVIKERVAHVIIACPMYISPEQDQVHGD